jgi:hypothetical protein
MWSFFIIIRYVSRRLDSEITIFYFCRDDIRTLPQDQEDWTIDDHIYNFSMKLVLEKTYHKQSHEAMESMVKVINGSFPTFRALSDANCKLPTFKTMRTRVQTNIPKVLIIAAWKNLETDEIIVTDPSPVLKLRDKEKFQLMYEISYVDVR